MVKELLTKDDFTNEILKSDKLVMVDFFATWCMPCKMLAPIIQELSDSVSDVGFYKLDVDKLGDIAKEYNIRGVPTLIMFKQGEIKETIVGGREKDALKEILEKLK